MKWIGRDKNRLGIEPSNNFTAIEHECEDGDEMKQVIGEDDSAASWVNIQVKSRPLYASIAKVFKTEYFEQLKDAESALVFSKVDPHEEPAPTGAHLHFDDFGTIWNVPAGIHVLDAEIIENYFDGDFVGIWRFDYLESIYRADPSAKDDLISDLRMWALYGNRKGFYRAQQQRLGII